MVAALLPKLYSVFHSTNQAYLVMELMSGGEIFDRIIEKVRPTAPAPPPANASFVCRMLDWNNKRGKLESDEQKSDIFRIAAWRCQPPISG